ncbi:rho guanine nucleotide exchange factor 2-like [Oryzias melastigma]|uniref:rho guanine nucleotide exchange factor 2-like n=1 Tax=Oryzias melastigma TaxID=30732 RepID=UPI00168CDEFD|nr:rho guanine nucleotide exchange factor 2-like [Oryzias melastigma]
MLVLISTDFLNKEETSSSLCLSELIQTEFHHVRTLRIMEGVYRRGMLDDVMLEAAVVHTIFPCLDQLLELHSSFLSELLKRRSEGLQDGSSTNFTVCRLADLLLRQFSGQPAEEMKKLYSEFCSRHPKAVKLYKEVLSRDRRLQQFIRVRPAPSDLLPVCLSLSGMMSTNPKVALWN